MRSGWLVVGALAALMLVPSTVLRAADPSAPALLQAAQASLDRGDEASAFAILRRLAIADDPEGQYRLGLLLERPRARVRPDPEGAAYWYERAAGQGHAGAAGRLGDLYASGAVGAFQSLGKSAPLIGEALRWYRLAAAKGDEEARNTLDGLRARSPLAAALLARAAGDHAAARAALETLARRNDLEAMYWRGTMQENGEGGPADPAGAVPWYEKSYQYGFGPAALALGRLSEAGKGVPRSIDQAYRMYGAANRTRSGEALAALQRLDLTRKLGAPPPPTLDGALQAISANLGALAAAILYPLAEAGNPDARYWLGTVEATGSWPGREEAIRWYRAAALQGDAEAAYQLAELLAPHRSVDAAGRSLGDAAQRVRWLKLAADAGHPQAALTLGHAYNDGQGVAADRDEANRWYQRSHKAEAGRTKLGWPACVEDPDAPELLGAYLACNRGDATGLAAALVPLAEAGNARAQAWVGCLMASCPGAGGGGYDPRVRANVQRAARWYAAAAEQGLPSAMYDYGVLLEHGLGVPVDTAVARQWYAKAAEKGHPKAREALEALGGPP